MSPFWEEKTLKFGQGVYLTYYHVTGGKGQAPWSNAYEGQKHVLVWDGQS